MPHRELNNHNTANRRSSERRVELLQLCRVATEEDFMSKKNGYFLGHSWTSQATTSITDNLITLSQALAYKRGNNTFYI